MLWSNHVSRMGRAGRTPIVLIVNPVTFSVCNVIKSKWTILYNVILCFRDSYLQLSAPNILIGSISILSSSFNGVSVNFELYLDLNIMLSSRFASLFIETCVVRIAGWEILQLLEIPSITDSQLRGWNVGLSPELIMGTAESSHTVTMGKT